MEYTITIGGRTRRLHYDMADRQTIEERFARPDGLPGELLDMIPHIAPGRGGSIAVQATILWAGLRHDERELQPAAVMTWLHDAVKKGQNLKEVLWPVLRAVHASGITGLVQELPDASMKDFLERMRNGEAQSEGKAEDVPPGS